MKIGSLFTGIGGLDAGLELCGLGPVVWQCDSDPAANRVLDKIYPGVPRYTDIRKMGIDKEVSQLGRRVVEAGLTSVIVLEWLFLWSFETKESQYV